MFTFHLRARDLSCPWKVESAGWSAGQSSIHPYRHRALDARAYRSQAQILFFVREHLYDTMTLKENTARLDFKTVSNDELASILVDALAYPLDFVLIHLRLQGQPEVSIRCGVWGTAPLYLLESVSEELWGDWNPSALYPKLHTRTVDPLLAATFLMGESFPYSSRTLFPDMYLLTERAHAEWKPSKGTPLQIEYPAPVLQVSPGILKRGADVLGAFQGILARSMVRWLDPQYPVLSTQLSGGLDSAIVSIVGASLTTSPVCTFGLIMPGSNGMHQQARRAEMVDQFGFMDCCLHAENYPPFSDELGRIQGRNVVPWQEFYEEAFRQLLQKAVETGCDLLYTGMGGDELFPLYWGELGEQERLQEGRQANTDETSNPRFLMKKASEAHREWLSLCKSEEAPPGHMAQSALQSFVAVSALYLSVGIWPVSPLCTPELVHFCRRLPREWREDRRLERDLLAVFGCSRTVTHPSLKETFTPLMDLGLQRWGRSAITNLFKESRLADLGLVDRDLLVAEYADYCEHNHQGQEEFFYSAAILELTLRSLETGERSSS